MLLPYAPEVALAEVGADERAPLEEQANAVPTAEVVRLVESLDDSLSRISRGGDPKLELELAFLKLARDYTEPDLDALLGRLETLEKAVENGSIATNPPRSKATEDTTEDSPEEPRPAEPEQEVMETEAPSGEASVLEELLFRKNLLTRAKRAWTSPRSGRGSWASSSAAGRR